MTAPTKKVNTKCTNLTLKRENNSIKATWKIPSAMKKDSDKHHAEFVECELDFQLPKTAKDKKKGDVYYGSASHSKGMSYTGYDDVTIKSLGMSTTVTKSYDRKRFHPLVNGRTVSSIKASVAGGNTPGEWKSNSTGWWWVRGDGTYPKNQWEYIDKKWYYFNSSGYMATGTITWPSGSGDSYTLASDGHLTSSGLSGAWEASGTKWKFKVTGGSYRTSKWGYISGQWYYFNSSGYMVTGTVTISGTKCTFASDGHYIPPSSAMMGPKVYSETKFSKPDAPAVSMSYDQSTATANITVKTDAGKDFKERYDTMVKVVVKKANGTDEVKLDWASTTQTEWKRGIDISSYLTGLTAGKSVKVTCYAYARGMAGDNPAKKNAKSASVEVGIPIAAKISGVTVDKKATGGTVKVLIATGSLTDSVKLQKATATDDSTPTGFSDVSGATDNGNATVLFDSYPAGSIENGTHVWYRIESTKYNYTTYSAPFEAKDLYTAKPVPTANARARVCNVSSDAAGNTATVVMGYTDDDFNDGCELSWSDYINAWNSTEQPHAAEFSDEQYPADSHKSVYAQGFRESKTVSLAGLTLGTTYYVKMRRYRTVDGEKVYSAYSEPFTFVAATNPASSQIKILSVDGSSGVAKVDIGYTDSTPYTATELSWAQNEDAWQSNKGPDTMQVTWTDETSQSQSWSKTQTAYLRGLEPGDWFLKARRVKDGGETPYTEAKSFKIPGASEAADVGCGLVSLTQGADGKSARITIGWDGDHTGCEATWSIDPEAWKSSEAPSSFEFEWEDEENLSGYYALTEDTAVVSGKTYYTRSGAGTEASPYVYTEVAQPSTSGISSYYEHLYAWSHTSSAIINGLEEGVTCYFKGRAYHDGDDRAWSDYTAAQSITPYASPSSVSIDAPATIARGSAIELWWAVESDQEQTEWHVHRAGYPNVSLAEGEGSLCHASIDPGKYGNLNAISLYVEAGCGGGLTRSDTVTIGIYQVPSCEAACAPTLTAQPASFEVYSDIDGSRVLATCYSDGITYAAPDGDRDQLAGQAVWTESLAPQWTLTTWNATQLRTNLAAAYDAADEARDAAEENVTGGSAYIAAKAAFDALSPGETGYDAAKAAYETALAAMMATDEGQALVNAQTAYEDAVAAMDAHPSAGAVYMATVTMPKCDLLDGGSYTIGATNVESNSGLGSERAYAQFAVAWSHQAPDPPEITMLVSEAERSVTMTFASPQDAAETDVFDLYRRTPAGYELVAEGLPQDATVTDPYAPYGKDELAYRIAVRTSDGDVSYADYPYELDAKALRFDWGMESAEFPYNIAIRRRMQKDYASRKHADGSVNGYWDRSVEMSGGFTTDIVKVADSELLRTAQRIGSYPGAVWVRDAYGFAMQCNVEVDEASIHYNTKAVGLSFSFSGMKTTSQFKPSDGTGA